MHWAEEGMPDPELYVPATHFTHRSAEAIFTASLYVPAAQFPHVASAVEVHTDEMNLPAAHEVHG